MSKRKKSSRLGYLPVQTLEAETPDSPSLSPGRAITRQVWRLWQLSLRALDPTINSGQLFYFHVLLTGLV
jgi:hypothetical protein